jgi:hypothetical protein
MGEGVYQSKVDMECRGNRQDWYTFEGLLKRDFDKLVYGTGSPISRLWA